MGKVEENEAEKVRLGFHISGEGLLVLLLQNNNSTYENNFCILHSTVNILERNDILKKKTPTHFETCGVFFIVMFSGMSVVFEGSREDFFPDLMSWAQENGASCEGFTISSFGKEGYGLRATRDIKVRSLFKIYGFQFIFKSLKWFMLP